MGERVIGIVFCVMAVMMVVRSFATGNPLTSFGTMVAVLLIFPGLLMTVAGAGVDTFLGDLPIIGPALTAMGVISGSSTGGFWLIELILTTQIACLLGLTCWGVNSFVLSVILSGVSYVILSGLKYLIASYLPGWAFGLGLVAAVVVLFILIGSMGLWRQLLTSLVSVLVTIGIFGVLMGGAVELAQMISGLFSGLFIFLLPILGLILLFRIK